MKPVSLKNRISFTLDRWAKRRIIHYQGTVIWAQIVSPAQNPRTGRQVHKCIPQESSGAPHPLLDFFPAPHLAECLSPSLGMHQTRRSAPPCTAVADYLQVYLAPGRLASLFHLFHSVPLPSKALPCKSARFLHMEFGEGTIYSQKEARRRSMYWQGVQPYLQRSYNKIQRSNTRCRNGKTYSRIKGVQSRIRNK